mmetsp:Transcript_38844/g.96310  ORF Transcript_38844/g.96310 Transcript_38844/m.96310 type:complete len:341 (-) Transcript_38844:206-1228(-)
MAMTSSMSLGVPTALASLTSSLAKKGGDVGPARAHAATGHRRLRISRGRGNGHARGGLEVRAAPASWWESLPLPDRVKRAGREIEYFGGSPVERLLPWVSSPKATPPGRPDPMDAAHSLVLFDFTAASPDSNPEQFARVWGELSDVVMGGQSSGAATVVSIPAADGGRCAKLSGVVEGEGGGFVSMRTRNFITPLDLEDYDGLKMRVRGDGRRYKLILRDTEDFFALSYHAPFNTVEGEWTDLELLFSDAFTPVLRANAVKKGESDYRDLNAGRIYSLQLMMSKYELGMSELNPTFASGPISLEVTSIAAYKHERALVEQVLSSTGKERGGGGEGKGGSA